MQNNTPNKRSETNNNLYHHFGSIRMFSDENGNRAGWSDYYPFGMKILSAPRRMPGRTGSDAPVDKRFRFTGKERDPMTGYTHFGARYYDPRIGRFLSVDPEAVSAECYNRMVSG